MRSTLTPQEAFEQHAEQMQKRLSRPKRSRMLVLLGAPFVMVMLFMAATSGGDDPQRDVTEAAERWSEAGPDSYRVTYTVTADGESFGPATAVVDEGTLTEFLTDDPALEDSRTLTVPGAFFAIEDTARSANGAVIAVEYDEDLGYARNATLDPDIDVDGDEWSFTVTEFVAAP